MIEKLDFKCNNEDCEHFNCIMSKKVDEIIEQQIRDRKDIEDLYDFIKTLDTRQGKDKDSSVISESSKSVSAVCEGCEEEEKNCIGVYMECIKKR